MAGTAAENDSGMPVNWIESGVEEKDGRDVKLASLRPKFDENSHRVYYDLLVRSIDANAVQNIALTGAYGTGKSSVLEELRKKHSGEIIELSLSTIASQQVHNADDQDTPETDKSKTNLIQKEIVKQLLYRLPAHMTPRSRFRRTSAPQSKRDWLIAGCIGSFLTLLAFALGLLAPVVEHFVPGPWVRYLLAYLILAAAGTCATWLIRRLIAGGPSMTASVGTALTSVTLSSNADTYFDEYLDEIVYFFQASKTKVVLIEDIDRFKDIKVFDTLRALNVLLNSTSILGRIVFIYAIRDSIFEQIEGTDEGAARDDPARRTLEIANRAKFFDVIIPVVPFVSADNARDLMSRTMKSSEFSIDQALIRIAARHTADMRLIHNIRNEFEVYRSRLIVPDKGVYGITDDLVFAMVVFKNAHLGDFEEIRHKNSTLDRLYKAWRQLVRENLAAEINHLNQLKRSTGLDERADARARQFGERLSRYIADLRKSLVAFTGGSTSITFSPPFEESVIRQRSTWQAIAEGASIDVAGRTPRNQLVEMRFDAERLSSMLGIEIDPAHWNDLDLDEIATEIYASEERIRFLRHHTWLDLLNRPEFTMLHAGENRNFDQLVGAILTSPLSRELVRRGHITSHFALYTSTYYGTHLGPEALEYVRRCVEPGEPDMLFDLDVPSIKQIFIEQGAERNDKAEIFQDPSILNVSILNYLLAERPEAAAIVAKNLSSRGDLEAEFVNIYCSRGELPEQLLAGMAHDWTGVVQYTAVEASLSTEKRLRALDAVLNALPHAQGYIVDEQVRERLETDFAGLTSITSPSSPRRAAIVMDLLKECQVEIADLSRLNEIARNAVVERALYPVNETNLRVLTNEAPISIDEIGNSSAHVYRHVLNHLSDYLDAFDDSDATIHTIETPSLFKQIVVSAAEHASPAEINRLISGASMQCRLEKLDDVPSLAWPSLVAQDRIDSTFTNTYSYFTKFGSFDEFLGVFHTRHSIIAWDQDTAPIDDRRELAIAILNAIEVIEDSNIRIDLSLQLDPGCLPVDEIQPLSGSFAGLLISKGLIPDDEKTYRSHLMVDWTTREAAISASNDFETLVSPETIPPEQVPQMIESALVSNNIKKKVVGDLGSYLQDANRQNIEQVSRALIAKKWTISAPRIQLLIDQGAPTAEIVQFLARNEKLPIQTLRDLLRSMDRPYSAIADIGTRPYNLPDDSAHRTILNALKGTVVSTCNPDPKKPGTLRVNLFKKAK